jgi:uncharacterized membrane protein
VQRGRDGGAACVTSITYGATFSRAGTWRRRPTGIGRVAESRRNEIAMTMTSDIRPPALPRPIVSDDTLAVIIYVLYCFGYFTGISALIGVVVAHVKIDEADPMLRSHYQFQIRTFWIGFLYITIGYVLTMVLIGIPILIWWFVWSLIRITKGFIAVNEHKPIAHPRSWLFG